MAHNIHDLGDSIQVEGTFRDAETDALIDPDVIKLSIKTPAGTVDTFEYGVDASVVKDSVGQYHAVIDATQAGSWYYRWWSTGSGQAANENWFTVREAEAVP